MSHQWIDVTTVYEHAIGYRHFVCGKCARSRVERAEACEPEPHKCTAACPPSALRDARLSVFADTFAAMLKEWIKQQAIEAAGWISVEERLPSDGSYVDFWVERTPTRAGQDKSSNERGWYNPVSGVWSAGHIHGEIGRYCLPGEEKVTHWRTLGPPPVNRQKIERPT